MYTLYSNALMILFFILVIGALYQSKKQTYKSTGSIANLLQKAELFAQKYWYVILAVIFLVFIFSRMFKLGLIPGGMNADEMGSAYDAQNLLNYHVDRYLTPFPVYLRNYGDGENALYAYLSAVLFAFTGFSLRAFRFVAVACGTLCFFASFVIADDLFHNKLRACLAPFFVTILPVYFMSERWGAECYLFLSFITVSFMFYERAIIKGHWLYYFFAGLFFGITLYTYAISYIVLLLFLAVSTLYLIYLRKFSFGKTVILAIPLALLATPLILFQLVNMQVLPEFRFLFTEFKRLPGYRGGDLGLHYIPQNLMFFKDMICGNVILLYNAHPSYGTLYLFSVPLILHGFGICIVKTIRSIREKLFSMEALLALLAVIAYFMALIILDPNVNKANEIYFPLMFFIAISVHYIWEHLPTILPVIPIGYMCAFLAFSSFYFLHYNDPQYEYLNFADVEVGNAIMHLNNNYDVDHRKIYIMTRHHYTEQWEEMIVLTYGGVNPYKRNPGEPAQDNYYMGLPENLSLEEDSLYILDNNWRHITNYLGENGFIIDDAFPNYAICYREKQN